MSEVLGDTYIGERHLEHLGCLFYSTCLLYLLLKYLVEGERITDVSSGDKALSIRIKMNPKVVKLRQHT